MNIIKENKKTSLYIHVTELSSWGLSCARALELKLYSCLMGAAFEFETNINLTIGSQIHEAIEKKLRGQVIPTQNYTPETNDILSRVMENGSTILENIDENIISKKIPLDLGLLEKQLFYKVMENKNFRVYIKGTPDCIGKNYSYIGDWKTTSSSPCKNKNTGKIIKFSYLNYLYQIAFYALMLYLDRQCINPPNYNTIVFITKTKTPKIINWNFCVESGTFKFIWDYLNAIPKTILKVYDLVNTTSDRGIFSTDFSKPSLSKNCTWCKEKALCFTNGQNDSTICGFKEL